MPPAAQTAGCEAGGVFVGRGRELAVLQAGLDEALAGRGRVLLLAGEPGIGKTRLAGELAGEAQRRGAHVLWGRCYEGEGAPPFWPWVQILRTYVTACDLQTLRAEMGAGAADITQVIPEVRERLPDAPNAAGLGSEQARFRFFDSVTTFLRTASRRQPLVLTLDDLHWADTPSLLLLQFLARDLSDAPLLLIGTYRNLVFGPQHPLTQALGELVRAPGSRDLQLHGLSEQDVTYLLEAVGLQPSEGLVSTLYRETDGNPFFLTEVVRLLQTESRPATPGFQLSALPIPQGVRAAIHRRLGPLSPACQQVLTLAAVVGREVDVAVLDAVGRGLGAAPTGERLLEVLEEAAAAQLISEVPQSFGRYSFSHALIREALYEELSSIRRVRLHGQIAEALESLYQTRPGPHLTELASHFFRAAQGGGDVDKALSYTVRAGEQAMTMLAYEDAASYYTNALQILSLNPSPDERQRCELLLALGEAHRRGGNIEQAWETFSRAADVARRRKEQLGVSPAAALLARAALGFGGGWWGGYGIVDARQLRLLEEALTALGEEGSALRARILAQLVVALYFSHLPNTQDRRTLLSQEAVAIARQVGDPATLMYALNSRYWALLGEQQVEARLAIATEIVKLAEEVNDKELTLTGRAWRLGELLEKGERALIDEELLVFAQLATESRQPFYLWRATIFRANQALLEGRFTEAEQSAQQAVTSGQQLQDPGTVQAVWANQLLLIRWEQGRLHELQENFARAVSQYPQVPTLRSALAFLYSELGRKADARREFLQAIHDFTHSSHDATWIGGVALLSQACEYLGDRDQAGTLYDLLRSHAQYNVVAGRIAAVFHGAVPYYLGLLATTLSRWEEAEPHFVDALAMGIRMRARPWVAHTQHDYARMLLARDRPGDSERAQSLLRQALATATELGMISLQAKVESLQTGSQHAAVQNLIIPSPDPGPRAPDSPAPNLFRREGPYWVLSYQGRLCRLRDARGLQYLSHLLREPGREFHVVDLMTLVVPPPPAPGQPPEQSTLQEVWVSGARSAAATLDAPARAAYKHRLDDLRDSFAEAERFNDPARAAQVQAEMDFITHELTAAYGIGGRARKEITDVERIRKAVAKAIRDSLSKIQKEHPVLWRHLFTSTKMGTYCSYRPESPIPWET